MIVCFISWQFFQLNRFEIHSHVCWWWGRESCWKSRQAWGKKKATIRNLNFAAQGENKHDKWRGLHPSHIRQSPLRERWGQGSKARWISAPKHPKGCYWPLQSPSLSFLLLIGAEVVLRMCRKPAAVFRVLQELAVRTEYSCCDIAAWCNHNVSFSW